MFNTFVKSKCLILLWKVMLNFIPEKTPTLMMGEGENAIKLNCIANMGSTARDYWGSREI